MAGAAQPGLPNPVLPVGCFWAEGKTSVGTAPRASQGHQAGVGQVPRQLFVQGTSCAATSAPAGGGRAVWPGRQRGRSFQREGARAVEQSRPHSSRSRSRSDGAGRRGVHGSLVCAKSCAQFSRFSSRTCGAGASVTLTLGTGAEVQGGLSCLFRLHRSWGLTQGCILGFWLQVLRLKNWPTWQLPGPRSPVQGRAMGSR